MQHPCLSLGSLAPSFQALNQDGQMVRLSDFKGKKLILYFYPKDNTPGCTMQAHNLRDHFKQLQEKGFAVVGISKDSVASHKKFAEKCSLPFPILADTDTSIAQAYGVYGEKKMMGKTYMGIHRTTFLIDEKGIITHIITQPDTKNHTAEILALYTQ